MAPPAKTKQICCGNFSFLQSSKKQSFLIIDPDAIVQEQESASDSLCYERRRSILDFDDSELLLSDAEPTPDSDLSILRPVWIVTTAALPWMTGTAVNPLLRAAYLAQHYGTGDNVHLVLPWLERPQDRIQLYGESWENSTMEHQQDYIQEWVQTNVGPDINITLHWYPARYHPKLGSIFAICDVCALLNVEESLPTPVAILEEPEHLNYFRGGQWRQRFSFVCGIIHTNYKAYAELRSSLAAPLVGAVSAWMVTAYCDKVLHLSATLPAYAPEKEIVCNVHGVRREFFQQYKSHKDGTTQAYFLGKLLWAKGLDKLLELQELYRDLTGSYFNMDIYGSGPEENEIKQAFGGKATVTTYSYWMGESKGQEALPVHFKGRVDHAKLDENRPGAYKIFVNPSISEVLCTVTAEALAMGKFVIIPHHPSNTFFAQFANCLQYHNDWDFVSQLQYALSHEPVQDDNGSKHKLTWEAATERLIQASSISHREAARRDRLRVRDQRLANLHIKIGEGTTGDVVRTVLGGGPVAKQSSSSLGTSFSRSSSSTSTEVASPESVRSY